MDAQLEQDHTIRAFGWFFLDFVHNAVTGGFPHEYSDAYDAHEQGFTTDDQFRSQATSARRVGLSPACRRARASARRRRESAGLRGAAPAPGSVLFVPEP